MRVAIATPMGHWCCRPQASGAGRRSTFRGGPAVVVASRSDRRRMDEMLIAILNRQDNIIIRRQALQTMSLETLRHCLRSRWQILLPGGYLAETGTPSYRERLRGALLYGGSSAQLADSTALRGYGVRYLPPDPTVRVLLPADTKRANRDGVEVRRTHRPPKPRIIDGLPHCPPERAAVEFAARIGHQRDATAVIADVVQRGVGSPQRIALEARRVTGRGAGIARRAVADVVDGARSAPEADLMAICARSLILPPPLLNSLLLLPSGRKVSPDALWEDAGLVHETNSREHHDGEDLFDDTQSRHDEMTEAGLTVLHDSPRQQQRESERILRQLETCYRRLVGRGLPPGVVLLRAHPNGPYVGL